MSNKILEQIAENPNAFDFRINEFFIVPKLEVYNQDNMLVYVNDQSHLHKLSGSINQKYAKDFISDLCGEIKKEIVKQIKKRAAQEKEKQQACIPEGSENK